MSRVDAVLSGRSYDDVITGFLEFIQTVYVAATSANDVNLDFVSGSGLARVNALEATVTAIAIAAALFLSVWALISELRASGTGNSDSFGIGMAMIRAGFLPLLVVVVLEVII